MLIGYVSDERYVALPETLLEFERADRTDGESVEARSRATGTVYAELEPGEYRVTLYKEGYGSKTISMSIDGTDASEPYQFRLLSDSIYAYLWPKWVQSGDLSEFRVHSPEAYKLELWRYGWEKEFVRTVGWYDEHGPRATVQITPDGDYTQGGVEWNKYGYSHPSLHQLVEAPERSGLYFLHAKGESGEFFSAPWIVAPRQPTAPIAVLASNITWNAYNNFGGRSNYINVDKLPPRPVVNARLDLERYTDVNHQQYGAPAYAPLSFERPEPINIVPEGAQITDPIEGRSASHIAPAEWRLLGWLEREGFDYDFYGETQFHQGVLNLDDYEVVILSTHPEYWSKEMYFALKEWVFERGGKLLYLGGNGLNCEVEFPDENTMIVQNGDKGGIHHLEGLGYESRFDLTQESEANLLGVVCTPAGIMTGAPYRVIDASHWIFDGTDLENGDLFGEKSLHMRVPGGASGHETDKMSPQSPANTQLLAKGLNPDDGGAEIVYHEPEGGGAVFSVGSISYTSSIVIDPNISQITRNVLERFLSSD